MYLDKAFTQVRRDFIIILPVIVASVETETHTHARTKYVHVPHLCTYSSEKLLIVWFLFAVRTVECGVVVIILWFLFHDTRATLVFICRQVTHPQVNHLSLQQHCYQDLLREFLVVGNVHFPAKFDNSEWSLQQASALIKVSKLPRLASKSFHSALTFDPATLSGRSPLQKLQSSFLLTKRLPAEYFFEGGATPLHNSMPTSPPHPRWSPTRCSCLLQLGLQVKKLTLLSACQDQPKGSVPVCKLWTHT